MNRCRYFRVSGRVQGVFYRASAQQRARELGLSGWVRNTEDGGVELVACGGDAPLRDLEAWLWQGPPAAQVESVAISEVEAGPFQGFEVRR